MRSVENSVVIGKPPAIVLDAFINPRDLKDWWEVEQSLIQLEKGGLYSLVWQQSDNALDFILLAL